MKRTGHKRSIEVTNGDEPRQKVFRPSSDSGVSGIILRIKLEHFMCHSELDWEPNRHVNFVTGLNGSGKSSILQGLVIGLLAESKHTKRYNKLQDFIQKDYSKALVQVTLKNQGEDAYKPDIYGKSITFQRTINENGSSAFLLMNEKNVKVVKNVEARAEGKRILELFRINTDNPIAILQQEEAKELLRVESPENLYNFFQKATLLKQCKEQYTDAEVAMDRTKTTLEAKNKQIKALGREVNEKHEQLLKLDRMIERDAEEEQLENEYVWARYHQNVEEREKINQKIAQKENAMEIPVDALAELNKKKHKIEQDLLRETEKLHEERKRNQREEGELTKLRQKIDGFKEDEKELRKNLKGMEQARNTATSEVRILTDQLKEMDKLQANREKMAKEREVKLEKLEKRRKSIADSIETAGAERDQLETEQETNKRDIDKNEYERKGYQTKVDRLEAELREMKGMGEAKLAVYDRLAPRVAEDINEACRKNQFRVKPIGPVGSYVKLGAEASANPDLARLLETEIGAYQIKAYLCDNEPDRKLLWEIFSRVYGQQKKPSIFTSKFLKKRHLVKRVEGYRTVMDFLDITGYPDEAVVVFNHLVDQKSIESVVVCKDQNEAKKISTYVERVPKNMTTAITHDFNRFFPPTNNTSYRSYYIDPAKSSMLGSNMINKIEEKTEEVQKAKATIADINEKMDKLMKTAAEINSRNDQIRKSISNMRGELQKTSSEKSQLKAEEEGMDNLDTLQANLAKKEKDLDKVNNDIDRYSEEREKAANSIKEYSKKFNEKTKQVSELRLTSTPIEREISKLEGQINSLKKEILNREKIIKQYQTFIQGIKKELKQNEVEGKKIRQAAEKRTNGKELKPSKSVIQLNAKIKQLREFKKKQDHSSEEAQKKKEILLEEFRKKRTMYTEQKEKVSNLEKMVEEMEGMNERRSANYLFIRKTISNIIARRFALESETFSSEYGNTIFIDINHQNRQLNFHFRNPEGESVKTDINSLSGGEKSYAQMCLIASLWENMNPPFRALDEWDVFLDNMNRKKMSRTLLGFGLQKPDYQFIFISPQGAADITTDINYADRNRVTIHEIKKS